MNTSHTDGFLPCYDSYQASQKADNDDTTIDVSDNSSADNDASSDDRESEFVADDWEVVREARRAGTDAGSHIRPNNEKNVVLEKDTISDWKPTYSTKLEVEADNQIYLTTTTNWKMQPVRQPFQDLTNTEAKQDISATSQEAPAIPSVIASDPSDHSVVLHEEEQTADESSLALDWEVFRKPRNQESKAESSFFNYGQHKPPRRLQKRSTSRKCLFHSVNQTIFTHETL